MKIVSETHTHDMGDGNVFAPGQAFDCPTKAAKRKIENGTAREASDDDEVVALQPPTAVTNDDTNTGGDGDYSTNNNEAPTGQDREDAILEACLGLDSDNAKLFTGTGAPKLPALSTVLGFDVTAAERDAAWVEVNK